MMWFPSAPKIAQETIAVLVATVAAAWLISRIPALQSLVRNNTVPGPFNP